jgi:parallel beta-helix repeat protein
MSTSGQLVENNEIAYNTYGERFHSYQDTGGGKLSKTLNLTVRGNYVHHNEGTGISTDWDNKGVLYENNRFEDNSFPGIIHEASYDAVIRNNVVRRNGFKVHTGSIDGSGIMISVSANVEVYGNQVERNLHGIGIKQSDRGPGAYGAHIAQNVNVHDNLVSTVANGIAAGLVGGENDPNIYCCKNLRFQSNDYVTCEPAGAKAGRWAWKRNAAGTIYISKSEWTAAGHDTTGTFATGC